LDVGAFVVRLSLRLALPRGIQFIFCLFRATICSLPLRSQAALTAAEIKTKIDDVATAISDLVADLLWSDQLNVLRSGLLPFPSGDGIIAAIERNVGLDAALKSLSVVPSRIGGGSC
jgi:hypothetical protein